MIAPDLRGLGDTSARRTATTSVGRGRFARAARDHLKLDAIGLVGHDWGGPTAYALTRLDPALVEKLAIIDVVIPGDGRPGGIAQGGARWHHGFHRTPHLPEALTAGREAIYLSYFYDEYVSVAGAITSADIAEYARTYAQPGAMRCGFEFYRTTDEDARINAEELSRLASCASRSSASPAARDADVARSSRSCSGGLPTIRAATCCRASATWFPKRRRIRSRRCWRRSSHPDA